MNLGVSWYEHSSRQALRQSIKCCVCTRHVCGCWSQAIEVFCAALNVVTFALILALNLKPGGANVETTIIIGQALMISQVCPLILPDEPNSQQEESTSCTPSCCGCQAHPIHTDGR